MGSKAGNLIKIAAPLALSAIAPGIGTALGAGLGASASFAPIVGNALIGGATGALTGGGVKGALAGAASGGIGGALSGGALGGTSLGKLLGTSAGTTLDKASGIVGAQGPTLGSGIKGALTGSTTLGNLIGGGGASSFTPALGAASTLYSNAQAQSQLKKATNQANAQLQPYNATGTAANNKLGDFLGLNGDQASTEEILAASPGYKFTLDQGLKAQDRANAARGGYYSGAALKDASNYTTGLANQTANDYYTKLAQTAGTGLSAAGAQGTNTTALGTAKGAANIQTGNTLAQLLSGYGRRVVGYDTNNQPIYG